AGQDEQHPRKNGSEPGGRKAQGREHHETPAVRAALVRTTKPTKPADDQQEKPLETLAKEIGKPAAAVLEVHLADTSDAALVDVGLTILSARVVTDASRLDGAACGSW